VRPHRQADRRAGDVRHVRQVDPAERLRPTATSRSGGDGTARGGGRRAASRCPASTSRPGWRPRCRTRSSTPGCCGSSTTASGASPSKFRAALNRQRQVGAGARGAHPQGTAATSAPAVCRQPAGASSRPCLEGRAADARAALEKVMSELGRCSPGWRLAPSGGTGAAPGARPPPTRSASSSWRRGSRLLAASDTRAGRAVEELARLGGGQPSSATAAVAPDRRCRSRSTTSTPPWSALRSA
jgi:hypothetical protein